MQRIKIVLFLVAFSLVSICHSDQTVHAAFHNDPEVIGSWQSVDFVSAESEFKAGKKKWQGDLFLKGVTFKPNGKNQKPWLSWTKGLCRDGVKMRLQFPGIHTKTRSHKEQ